MICFSICNVHSIQTESAQNFLTNMTPIITIKSLNKLNHGRYIIFVFIIFLSFSEASAQSKDALRQQIEILRQDSINNEVLVAKITEQVSSLRKDSLTKEIVINRLTQDVLDLNHANTYLESLRDSLVGVVVQQKNTIKSSQELIGFLEKKIDSLGREGQTYTRVVMSVQYYDDDGNFNNIEPTVEVEEFATITFEVIGEMSDLKFTLFDYQTKEKLFELDHISGAPENQVLVSFDPSDYNQETYENIPECITLRDKKGSILKRYPFEWVERLENNDVEIVFENKGKIIYSRIFHTDEIVTNG